MLVMRAVIMIAADALIIAKHYKIATIANAQTRVIVTIHASVKADTAKRLAISEDLINR